MNERIMELFEQAAKEFSTEHKYATFMVPNPIKEKFAQLIVRECIDCVRGAGLADDVAVRNKLGYNDGIAEGVVHIQKHFGVKE
jgi:hypothetical protein